MTLMGAGLLWVGWFGFNAGSSIATSQQTARALAVTQIAAAMGALTWISLEALLHRKATSLGLCSGILAGLVAITPAAGDVPPYGAMALGMAASLVCYGAILLKNRLGYDDTLDVFGIHGVGGIVGAMCLVFFLREPKLDVIAGVGEVARGVGLQLWYQAKGVGVAIVFAAVLTSVLLVVVDKVFGLKLTGQDELAGMDHSLHGEHGYGLLNLN